MKLNKLKLVIHACILLFIVIFLVTILYLWQMKTSFSEIRHNETKLSNSKEYLVERNKDRGSPSKLKEVYSNKDSNYKNIDSYLRKSLFNGSVAIYENGKLKMSKGYGYQDFEKGIRNTPNTMFLIGSAQKFSTGLLLKLLEEEKKIDINDPVNKYIEWFETSKPILLKDLMLHQSGLYKYKSSKDYKDLNQAVKSIQKQGINPKKYKKYMYNDANYLVLAKVIEEVTGKSYAENFYNEIGDLLKLRHTAFFDEKPFTQHFAKGYVYSKVGVSFLKPNILDQYYGAGNLYMTPTDMGSLITQIQQYKLFNSKTTNQLLHEFGTKQYPNEQRYGFYVRPTLNRLYGVFFGQVFAVYFNDKYVVVLASNVKDNNEARIKHIYKNILK
ncbi:TPA: beta-lactamase family protein, partial [Staphylococcus aureus]|nr:beta-lactamase family protein [Staphylococcus aureus]HCX2269138.1 beta-lactamase family protein [Staphylococcus aureus]HCX2359171.1 beta-lactamase family protein [Staphylococcus aureus]HCX2556850.1 beta-lactamase family protein [Staphylococcus aureus]HCX2634932.1 beta-lactamase family protein [Staphylococcus aureus]